MAAHIAPAAHRGAAPGDALRTRRETAAALLLPADRANECPDPAPCAAAGVLGRGFAPRATGGRPLVGRSKARSITPREGRYPQKLRDGARRGSGPVAGPGAPCPPHRRRLQGRLHIGSSAPWAAGGRSPEKRLAREALARRSRLCLATGRTGGPTTMAADELIAGALRPGIEGFETGRDRRGPLSAARRRASGHLGRPERSWRPHPVLPRFWWAAGAEGPFLGSAQDALKWLRNPGLTPHMVPVHLLRAERIFPGLFRWSPPAGCRAWPRRCRPRPARREIAEVHAMRRRPSAPPGLGQLGMWPTPIPARGRKSPSGTPRPLSHRAGRGLRPPAAAGLCRAKAGFTAPFLPRSACWSSRVAKVPRAKLIAPGGPQQRPPRRRDSHRN